MSIIGAEEIRFLGGDGIHHVVDRRNRLFELYAGTIGMKTGLTDRAGRCLVAAATRGGRTMLAVLFDAPDIYASAALHLPDVVPGAALDPPERIPGALDPQVVLLASPSSSGVDWDSPRVAVVVLLLGAAPALLVRRRLAARAVTDVP